VTASRLTPVGALATIAGMVLVEAVCWALAFAGQAGTLSFWLLTCGPTIALGIVGLVYADKKGLIGKWLHVRADDLALGLLVAAIQYGLAWAAANWLLPHIPGGTTWLTDLYGHLGTTAQRRAHPILSFLGLLVTCGFEEIVWRGFATALAEPTFGVRKAFAIQVLANTLLYVPMAVITRNPIIPCAAFVGGVATGLLAVWRGSRLPGPILGHGPFDFSVVVLWPLVR
jgi:Type II CAAX prenyl endopeptidase Rce1-like